MSSPEPSLRVPSESVGLLTDLYQLTMAYGYWKMGELETEAAFNLFYRSNPFEGGYAIACGLGYLVDFVESFAFPEDDIAYLAGLKGNDGEALFEEAFLEHLHGIELRCDIDAVPEGTTVFAHEPLVRVRGPLIECQLLETALVNIINFQSLIATKASRVCEAAQGDRVIEFGLRRAQAFDGALAASNELDEYVITSLKDQGARINVWGVGTKLITDWDQPALGAIYKLAAVRRPGGDWEPKVKLSEQAAKVNVPGFCQVRRFRRDGEFIADMIHDELDPPAGIAEIVDPMDSTRWKKLPPDAADSRSADGCRGPQSVGMMNRALILADRMQALFEVVVASQ